MTISRLDDYFPKNNELVKTKLGEDGGEQLLEEPRKEEEASEAQALKNLPPSYFVSATYDGDVNLACIKLYNPDSKQIYKWYDNTGHKPYCLTNLTPEEIKKIPRVADHPGFEDVEVVEKYDALQDRTIKVTKIIARDPLSIGGRPRGCIRDIIPEDYPKIFGSEKNPKIWEAAIKYYQCYIYDRKLLPGMPYRVRDGDLIPVIDKEAEENIKRILETSFKDEPKDLLPYLESWIRLLEYPAADMKRVALDIEVYSPIATRVPDAEEAPYQVICASLVDSEGKKRVLLLRREEKMEESEEVDSPSDVDVTFFDDEKALISEIFRALDKYPFVITFNGDDFDLKYLYHRAQKMGFRRKEIPIDPGRRVYSLRNSIHIDLYKFFYNRSIQVYAFAQKYRNVTLDEVASAILGKSKIEISKPISELSYSELAKYCLNDAEITLELTSYDDDLVMKLLLVLTRISKMPMEDVSRQGVSRWIRSFMQYEHRRKNMLIPNQEDIIAVKGKTTTKAIIKGKKYKGAIVVHPVPGVHFNVAVMDFQSLYPSIIKVHNLGYQSVRCPHEECKRNIVPGTNHWICIKQRALESALIGSLRDLRVYWYKPRSKDKSLPEAKRNWYNVIQRALKVILNASYGVFGAETFDLYCPPVAEATAAIGREVITKTIRKAEELGIQVLYGDTDSIFLKNPSPEQIKTLSEWAEKTLGMELDVDKLYRYAVLSSRKKNYLGVFEDGSVDVKGLTGKKRHIPRFIKRYFDELEKRLAKVESPAEFEEAKEDITKIVQECYYKLKRREWEDINDLAFEVVLGKSPETYTKTTPQHVKAARLLAKRGVEIKAGDLIRFVKVIKDPYVKPVELASDDEIDADKYIAYLQSTFDQILDALGLDFEKIIGLTRLEQFM